MHQALQQARIAGEKGDVHLGAVVVHEWESDCFASQRT
jgi:tRNA(Arg) A34 adenosine deaminase TadA